MNPFSQKKDSNFYSLNLKGKLISLRKPIVMGILNITPDSFYAGSRLSDKENILKKAKQMLDEGAAILDVGAYSSRPNATHISEEEENTRAIPAIHWILEEFPEAIISIDTFRASVAENAVNAGAAMVNDISGGELDAKMFETISKLDVPYCLMHMRGTPQTMREMTDYNDIIFDIMTYFERKIHRLNHDYQVKDIIIDLGFGFAKTMAQNFYLLNHLDIFQQLGRPILAGLSRKSMIHKTLGISSQEALNGTTVLNTVALQKSANILRVHDVREVVEAIELLEALEKSFGKE